MNLSFHKFSYVWTLMAVCGVQLATAYASENPHVRTEISPNGDITVEGIGKDFILQSENLTRADEFVQQLEPNEDSQILERLNQPQIVEDAGGGTI